MSRHRTLLVGASGHAKVCLEVLRSDPTIDVVGCVSADGLADPGLDVPVLGVDEARPELIRACDLTHVFVAIGDNARRADAIRRWTEAGLQLATAIAPSAVVSASAAVGPGTLIGPGAIVNADARLGIGVIVNSGACVEHDVVVGSHSHLAPGAVIAGASRIGKRCLVGVGSRVVQLVSIGDDVTIGAGAVVLGDVDALQTVVGVPARPLGVVV